MSNIEAMFAGMDQANLFGTGQWFAEGNFVCRTKSFKCIDGFKGRSFIAECEVVESNNPKDKPGDVRSWVVKMGGTNRNAFGDIKGMIFAAAMGLDPTKMGQPTDPGNVVVEGIFSSLPITQRTMTNAQAHAQATQLVMAACDADYARKVGLQPGMLENIIVRLQTFAKPTRATQDKPQGGVFTVHKWFPATSPAPTNGGTQ